MLLEDKVAIVSGVGPGLGQAAARALAREGARVVLAARNTERLDEVATQIDDEGGASLAVPTNLVDEDSIGALVDRTVSEFGGVDVLVNNAFRMDSYKPVAEADLEHWRKVFEVNVFGATALTQACVPHLRKAAADHGDASIVFVSSMSSRRSTINEGGYAASKGAVNTIVHVMAGELGADRVRVNGVVPGWIGGPAVDLYVEWQAGERGVDPATIRAEIEARIPLGLIPPQDDIAHAIVFFASPWSRVITGQLLDVNGGEHFG